jgi:hypothetical protein
MKFLENLLFYLAIAVIICLCYISMFNTYQTDDYGFAARTNDLGFVPHIVEKYFHWGGRFFSFSLNALNPAGNLSLNWIPKVFPVFLWGNLILGFFLNFRRYFKLNKAEAFRKSCIAFLFYTVVLASLYEHYYWISGALVYFLPHIFALYFIYLLGIKNPKFYHQLLKFLLIIVMMGSNEIVAIYLLLFLAFLVFETRTKTSVFQFVTGFIFFCVLFFAPGNFVRLDHQEGDFLMTSIKKIGVFLANNAYVFLKVGLVIPLFLAVFHAEISKINREFTLKTKWIFQGFSFVALAFTGFIMLVSERTIEPIIIYSLLSISVLVMHYLPKIKKLWIFSLLMICIPSITLFPYKLIYFKLHYNINPIFTEALTTDLQNFEKEIFQRHETLRNSKDEKVVLKPIKIIPKVLYFGELGTAENRNYVNQQLEAFYGKKEVVLFKKLIILK